MPKASKNQRVAKTASRPDLTGGGKILIPLNHGKHAYVNVGGKNLHLATDGDKFIDAVRELGESQAPKVRWEIERFAELYPADNWDKTLKRLEDAGAL